MPVAVNMERLVTLTSGAESELVDRSYFAPPGGFSGRSVDISTHFYIVYSKVY